MNDVRSLYCMNPECPAKKIKSYVLFVSRDAFNIEGLSEATLEKFVQAGFIHEYADIFKLDAYKEQIVDMEGFGEKSYANLIASVKKAESVLLPKFIYSLGIPGVGLSNARLICKAMDQDFNRIRRAKAEDFVEISGIGQVIADSIVAYFADEANNEIINYLLAIIHLEAEATSGESQIFEGKTFVITGSLEHFANRNELKTLIESLGGKVAGSVSSKTSYLINNDAASGSSKNKKARELSIPILTEVEFLELMK